jgi:sterol 3beta-glucosyltransferase
MKIAIHTFGTRGDVQPYIALGLELKSRGHEVTLTAPRDFTRWIESFGLLAKPIDLDMGEYLREAESLGIMRNPLKAIRYWDHMIEPMLTALIDIAIEGVAGSDVVIAHPKALFSAIGAEATGALFVMTAPLPIIAPTAAFPMPATFAQQHGALWNKLSWMPLKFGMIPYKKRINTLRRSLGLAPVGGGIDYATWLGKPALRLIANSGHVLPRPADWGPKVHMTGYWELPASTEPLDAALETFLQKGPMPVYIGFGSMLPEHATRLVKAAVKGLKKAGLRGVINRGWAKLSDQPGQHVHFIDSAPHEILFPRCCVLVHHGGAGTTGAALKAGKPSLIVPFIVDQPWWAERLREQGFGPAALTPGRFTAGRFARALKRLIVNESYATRCREVSQHLTAENGAACAADLIEAEAGS